MRLKTERRLFFILLFLTKKFLLRKILHMNDIRDTSATHIKKQVNLLHRFMHQVHSKIWSDLQHQGPICNCDANIETKIRISKIKLRFLFLNIQICKVKSHTQVAKRRPLLTRIYIYKDHKYKHR